jgi:transglutaminase-like putative cysteine protease
MDIPLEVYLRPTRLIDCGARSIKEKAQDLTKGQRTTVEKARSLFYFVRDGIKYNPYPPFGHPELYGASLTLARGEGYCVQKAILLAALARAAGTPARLRFAAIRNHLSPRKLVEVMGTNLFIWHGYDELFIEDKWVKATPTFDAKMCQKNRIIPVEFDGENDAVFHSHNRDGKLHIEYVKDHGHYQDVPLDRILAFFKAYGVQDIE